MKFEEAFAWVNEHGGVVRFFKDVHTDTRKIRLSVPTQEGKDPVTMISTIHPSDATGMATFAAVVERVKPQFDAQARRAQIRLVG